MKKALAVNKKLDLLNEFMKYAFDNPKVLEGIPPEGELIILPINDPELYEYNRKMADKIYNGPQNSDSVISYTWEIKGGGPSGTNAKEVSAFI